VRKEHHETSRASERRQLEVEGEMGRLIFPEFKVTSSIQYTSKIVLCLEFKVASSSDMIGVQFKNWSTTNWINPPLL